MAQERKSRYDEALIMALACGGTVQSAAKKVDLGEATVYRRLKDKAFVHRLRKTKSDLVNRTAGMLTAAASEAVKTLLALQKDTTPAGVRLGAARAILEIGMKLREVGDLQDRITALEEQLNGGA